MKGFAGVSFYKMSGTGNDFVIFDNIKNQLPANFIKNLNTKSISRICSRGFGVGADGLLILNPSIEADFSWEFYNADGSTAEMCGNASRCVAWLAHALGYAKTKMSFKAQAGIVSAQVDDGNSVSTQMPISAPKLLPMKVKADGVVVEGVAINTGVPHFVIESAEDFRSKKELARALRNLSDFGSRGTNVTFFKRIGDTAIESITFERGVEDFTLACGTGAVAAALVSQGGRIGHDVSLKLPGGHVTVKSGALPETYTLKGEVRLVYIGELNFEVLNESV